MLGSYQISLKSSVRPQFFFQWLTLAHNKPLKKSVGKVKNVLPCYVLSLTPSFEIFYCSFPCIFQGTQIQGKERTKVKLARPRLMCWRCFDTERGLLRLGGYFFKYMLTIDVTDKIVIYRF